MAVRSIKCKVKILCHVPVYTAYQPVIGGVYDADYRKPTYNTKSKAGNVAVCVIRILDKSICLKPGEYEILKEGECDGN